MDIGKMADRIARMSAEGEATMQAGMAAVMGNAPRTGMPNLPSPYEIRLRERQEIIAAVLSAGMTAANGGLVTIGEVMENYRLMLAELRDPKEGNFGV